MHKIFYKYSTCQTLEPISGDRINEMMNVKAIEEAGFKVAYNGRVMAQDFGAAYIRASESYFRQAEGLKRIWFASPYNPTMMRNADRIATFSDTWTDMLRVGTKFNLNPDGIAWRSKVITIPQTIDSKFFTKKGNQPGQIVFAFIGKIRNLTYPGTFFKIWKEIKVYTGGKLVILGSITEPGLTIPKYAQIKTVPHKEMPAEMEKINILIEGNHGVSWDYSGCIRILEAAAMGIPIIMERSRAREEDFTQDYPFFVPVGTMTDPNMAPHIAQAVRKYMDDPHVADPYLRLASSRHNIKNTSKVIGNHLKNMIDGTQD
jgi:hypothetical protein